MWKTKIEKNKAKIVEEINIFIGFPNVGVKPVQEQEEKFVEISTRPTFFPCVFTVG